MAFNRAGADYFRNRLSEEELRRQDAERKGQEKEHSKSWWKRGLGQGLLGALPGIITLNPVQAAAGAAGGFGGEAVNHYGFKDKHPEIAGNAAALASLGSGAASKGLFSAAGDKAGLGGFQKAASGMGNNAAYNAEIDKALNPAFNSAGVSMPPAKFDTPITPQTTGASGFAEQAGPSSALQDPRQVAAAQAMGLSPEELQRLLANYGRGVA